MKLPKIIHYVDDDGKILWTDPMIYKRLWAVGDWLMHDFLAYQVRWVSLSNSGNIQRVEIVPCKVCEFCSGVIGDLTGKSPCYCKTPQCSN